jgi:preprotein translocase subunit SecA
VVYQQRTEIMGTEDLSAAIAGIREEAVGTLMDQFMPKSAAPQEWDLQGLAEALARDFSASVDPAAWLAAEPELEEAVLRQRLVEAVATSYEAKVARIGAPIMRHVEKDVMLKTLDHQWREHLAAMDYLRQGIHLRGYAQKDYRFEYKREAFELFAAMLDRVKFDTVSVVSKLEIRTQEEADREEEMRRERLMQQLQTQHAEAQSALFAAAPPELAAPGAPLAGFPGGSLPATAGSGLASAFADTSVDPNATFIRQDRKVGRNEPCPCGSGKKFKHCHGALSE